MRDTSPSEREKVFHHCTNHLGVIIGLSELVISELPPDSPVRSDLQEIANAGHAAVSLLNTLRQAHH